MALIVKQVSSVLEINLLLRGGIRGGAILKNANLMFGFYGLVGETVTFQSPAMDITFVPGADPNGFLSFLEIKKQIEAGCPDVEVSLFDGRLMLKGKDAPLAISIGSEVAQPARAILGFDGAAGGYSSGAVYGAPSAESAPRLVSIIPSSAQDNYLVILETLDDSP